MNTLFETTRISDLQLKNRFVRAATWEGLATPAGSVTPELVNRMAELADGGVGLIISSHAYVSPEGRGTPWQLGVYQDDLLPGLAQMSAAVHENGGKILLQLAHAGIYAETAGLAPLAVSESGHASEIRPKVLIERDIQGLVDAYAQAARRARDADFDGIEIHSGHGYLLSQFLSPAYNQRRDRYGGSVRNRTRIHLEILQAVRELVGDRFPVVIKMNCMDFLENGLTAEDALAAAARFAEAGFNAVEVSGGIIRTGNRSPSRPGIHSPEKEAYFKDFSRLFKETIECPVILVGGLRSFKVAERIISDGMADYISMSRPLIREPDLIRRWQNGDLRRAECISDNLCFNPGFEGKGVHCVTREIQNSKVPKQPDAGR